LEKVFEIQDYNLLIGVLAFTLVTYLLTLLFLHSREQTIMFSFFTVFYWFYNGYGISFVRGVHKDYPWYYAGFYLAFCISYIIFLRLSYTPFKYIRKSTIQSIYRTALSQKVAIFSISFYMLVSIFPLIHPTVRLDLLLHPPKPDIVKQFLESFSEKVDVASKIVANLGYIVFPFYLMSFYYYRKRPIILFIIIFLPLYFHYCNISYINRGLVLEKLVTYGAILYTTHVRLRKFLLIGTFAVAPLLIIFAVQYTQIRGGEKASDISVGDAVTAIVNIEGSFPVFSKKIINSHKSINLKDYFVWMVTLPIPKVIIGKAVPVSAAGEMAEILLGIKQGKKGFFFLLAGLLTESIYTFGQHLFFLHAMFIALFMALAVRFVERNTVLFPLTIVYTIMFSYTLNRGGIASALPVLINQFMIFYIFIFSLFLIKISRNPVSNS